MPRKNEESDGPGYGVHRLNAGERACLDLVAEGKVSKQIGRELDVPPNTVDDRIRSACRKLGANNRTHAAQIYVAAIYGAKPSPSGDTSILRPENRAIPDPPRSSDKRPSTGESDGSDDYDRERLRRLVSLGDSRRGEVRTGHSHPIASFFWGTNKLSAGRRIAIILFIALGFVVAVGTLVNGLTALSRLLEAPQRAATNQGG